MIGIYLLLPVLKSFICQASKASIRTFLIIMFVLTVAIPSLNDALGTDIVTLVWLPSYVFYFVLGYYLFSWERLTKRIALCCVTAAGLGCVIQVLYVLSGDYGEWLRSADSVFVAALSLLAFLVMKRYLERPYKPSGIVAGLSSYSFGIYVLHPLFLNVAYKLVGLGPWSVPPVIFEVSMWAFAFFGSIAMIWFMRRIPGIRRIL